MKKIVLIALLLPSIIFLNCNNDDDKIQFESTGKILGIDAGYGPCRGNWRILIYENEREYQFFNLPEDSNIDLDNASFPIEVKLNWRVSENSACGFIIIDKIELN